MTEQAPDLPADAEQRSQEAGPRPRRRRSRGRGRGPSRPSTAETKQTATPAPQPSPADAPPETGGDDQAKKPSAPRRSGRSRSRRRGGRGGGGAKPEASTETGAQSGRSSKTEKPAATPTEPKTQGDGQAGTQPDTTRGSEAPEDGAQPARRRRRRRRRKSPAAAGTKTEGGSTTSGTKVDEPAVTEASTATAASAPTRTSRRARRPGTDRRHRRPPVLAPRRTDKTMLMTEREDRLQIAVVEGRDLVEHYVTKSGVRSMVGNIYLGRVQNVLPGMEAAFVDVGRGRNAVLYAGEVSYDEDVEAGQRRIESVLKAGQSVMVQVTKDPLRGKGARLTAQISLPGRYLVYVPDGGASGISRRLPDDERERLRKIMKKIRPSEAGVIIRTAAEGASEEDLAADLDRLKKAWESIRRKAKRSRAPKELYEEPELIERVVRDVFSPAEFQQIVTDSPEVYERVAGYLRDVAPDLVDRVSLHQGSLSLFEEFHVAEQIHKALERKVWLPSGGYLIMDRVEAMTVIDVNTGKHVGKTNLEETVTGTNLEAAEEIARQLRLRDIGGIIVIDFIDMLFEQNRAQVIRKLQESLAKDKTRSQVFDITPLGLLEMTRKKVSAGLLESFSEPCPTCEGRGILLTHDL